MMTQLQKGSIVSLEEERKKNVKLTGRVEITGKKTYINIYFFDIGTTRQKAFKWARDGSYTKYELLQMLPMTKKIFLSHKGQKLM